MLNRQGGFIGGQSGVVTYHSLRLVNQGKIKAVGYAVFAHGGGAVVNGGYHDLGATILGQTLFLGSGTVSNFGTIGASVELGEGGTVVNGAAGRVNNGGSIRNCGIYLVGGGALTNGYPGNDATISDPTHDIDFFAAGSSTLTNYGTVIARQAHFYGGAFLTNGSASVTDAQISGSNGVRIDGVATVTNFGVIAALGRGYYPTGGPAGVQLRGGGRLVNGSAVDRTAMIHG